ncbi:ABC-type transport auxiliary lipoprotein family protein [Halopseudomonas maritima]|uniref:ABC-type transport auxiliary lipoprotein family protein n=1 Tax=Halopseudomonas maritima TaxID=2918528 RepID=UPI001EEB72A6|nr:ABC-type transport auxiliary lipoprotein family protein [Halopseudomonas maritima]UJJ32505.1 membrane integrity-associated transporter subunit PqiC [Halopseudomonas maritima]
MTFRTLTSGLALAGLLSACSVLPKSEPLTFYQMPAPALDRHTGPALPISLRITTPASSSALQTTRILVTPDNNTLSSYQGARWADPNPSLLREQLVQAFEQDGSFSSVTTETHAVRADVHLFSDLRQFQTRYQGQQASVVIELDAKLIDPSTRAVIAARHFSVQQPLPDTAVNAVVDNFGVASEQLARELLAWSRDALNDVEPTSLK